MPSEKSGLRLPSEQPAAAIVQAGSSYVASRSYGGARAASRARAAKAPAGAIAAAAAAIAAAASIAASVIIAAAGCSDGNLGPDFSDGNLGLLGPQVLGDRWVCMDKPWPEISFW